MQSPELIQLISPNIQYFLNSSKPTENDLALTAITKLKIKGFSSDVLQLIKSTTSDDKVKALAFDALLLEAEKNKAVITNIISDQSKEIKLRSIAVTAIIKLNKKEGLQLTKTLYSSSFNT